MHCAFPLKRTTTVGHQLQSDDGFTRFLLLLLILFLRCCQSDRVECTQSQQRKAHARTSAAARTQILLTDSRPHTPTRLKRWAWRAGQTTKRIVFYRRRIKSCASVCGVHANSLPASIVLFLSLSRLGSRFLCQSWMSSSSSYCCIGHNNNNYNKHKLHYQSSSSSVARVSANSLDSN